MATRAPIPAPAWRRQRGIALLVVIVLVMLSMLLALWALRSALFHEMLVGNDADYQRAFEAAQALLLDAELDIRGERADGSPCAAQGADGAICRHGSEEKIPAHAKDLADLLARLDALPDTGPKCRNGLCLKRADRPQQNDRQDFWNNTDPAKGITLAQMTGTHADGSPVGARYGQFTGASAGDAASPANPILAERSRPDAGGWYWIEVLPYDGGAGNSSLIVNSPRHLLALHLAPSVVYRITAIAHGRKPATLVVLQQTYARQKLKD